MSGWKYAGDQVRLMLAEQLIHLALAVTPKDHPDSMAIILAANAVSLRDPTKGARNDDATSPT